MRIEDHAGTVVIWAPAKVNLYLEVLAKRADGYHEIATLMLAVSLCDKLEFKEESSGDIQLVCDLQGLSSGPDNLVHRAASLLKQASGCRSGARIELSKKIPLAAGLAGGSSDAAAALAGLNQLWGLGYSTAELAAFGSQLGSDVAFFFATPAAWCTGRGEQVSPVKLGKTLHLVLICPRVGLATAEVYRGLRMTPQASPPGGENAGDKIRQAVEAGDVVAIGLLLHNRLQGVAEQLCPAVAHWRQRLEQLGPAGHLMSGSGSSLFALCRDPDEAQRLAQELCHGSEAEASPLVCVVTSCS